MSYEIIKSIKVNEAEGKVYIRSCSNNVYPRTPHLWECTSLSRILLEQGKAAVEAAILKEYEGGMFQGTENKYTRAITILRHLPEYHPFDWRGEPHEEIQARRKTPVFAELLQKALTLKQSQDKFTVSKVDYNGITLYARKITRKHLFWTQDIAEAKISRYKDDAEWLKKGFTGSETWQVLDLTANETLKEAT